MHKIISYIFMFLIFSPEIVYSQNKLLYTKPAVNFNEALPLGNGRIGAMVYGRVQTEYISLNESTLWSGGPDIQWNNPDVKKYLPLIREAALKGEYKKADSLCKFMQGPYTESYMPMADLNIEYKNISDSSNYRRMLNLDSAVATTTFKSDNINFKRTAFASFPDSVIVIRNEADKKAALSFDILLASKLHFNIKTINNNEIILTGKCPKHVEPAYLWKIKEIDAMQYGDEGMSFTVRVKIIHEGGRLMADDKGLHLSNANAATILVTAATSFNGFDKSPSRQGKNNALIAEQAMQKATSKTYSDLLNNHINDYKPFYERVRYDFGKSHNEYLSAGNNEHLPTYEHLPTDERLKKMSSAFDPELLATIVQYGRYILIASSRAGGQPSNLKGLWNEKLRPEYSSNWCIDHDAQMSYYPVETNNLSEMHQPFLQLIKELSENGYKTANINYGMGGWCAHHNTDIWRKSSPVGNWGEGNPHWANWNVSGAWLSDHYMEHFKFTLDTNFLRRQAYPIMKGAAEFFLDWLIPDSTNKYLISVPSFSPENTFITKNGDTAQTSVSTTSDIELVKDLFKNFIKTAEILHIKNAFIDSVQSALNKLMPYPIGANGQLLEWQQDWRSTDPAHRHLSHMYAVFPGSEISPLTTPQLAEAAKKALSFRAKTNGSWGFAWKAACWARLNEGDSAWQTLQYQLNYVNPQAKTAVNNLGLYPNLFNSEVPGIILNGNTCITAAVTEMLLQSQTGVIDLLPALPKTFKQGEVKGLVARGGFVVNIVWKGNALTAATIYSRHNNPCKIKLNNNYAVYQKNKRVILKEERKNIYSFDTKAGETYVISKHN
ncbi:glycoside hydrolase family 95 protein [Flavitalea sp.]|nr:glycoside hydrolase family 95 protein [Flavitalea sp.]